MKNEDYNKVIESHLGARELEIENVRLMIPNIGNIKDLITDFRKNAENSLAVSGYEKELKELSYEKYDNFISILGNRGLGKTSIMLTTIQQIRNEQYYAENIDKNQYCSSCEPYCPDLISPLIVPDEMSEISDNLGWIIVILEDMYYHQIKCYVKQSCLLNQSNELSEYETTLKRYLQELKENYHHRKEAYKNIVDNRYESNTEYIDKASKIQKQDLAIVNSFKNFVDAMISYKRYVNYLHNCHKEPLIFFFFDDVDMTACNCESIFEDFLTFLSNPHIVTFISGDYDLFLQSVTLKMLEKEKMYHWDINDIYVFGKDDEKYKVVEMAKNRSEFFLKKVLPPLYRFEIQLLNNKRKSKLSYAHHNLTVDPLLRKTINQLLKEIYHYHSGDQHTVNDFFVKDNKITIYPYYAVFSCNVRGFINVYLFLYREAKRRRYRDCAKTPKECVEFMREFLDIILNSKNTYRKNLDYISRFLYIKDDDVDDNNAFSLLRIDCEELNEIIIKKINENNKVFEKKYVKQKPYILDEYKIEIEALIMLPLLINELQYAFFTKEYETRYKRIQKKLKNILVNIFVSKFNPYMEMLIPDKADISEILLFYSFVTTRMSMTTINAINGNRSDYISKQNDLYKMNNDKKYIVQIFKAICEIYSQEMITINDQKENLSVINYNQVCYEDIEKRNAYEREIAKVLIDKYRSRDYQWLTCLFGMIKKNISSVNELYPYEEYYNNHIYPIFENINRILTQIDDTELPLVIHFLEELDLVFSIDNIISYKNDDSKIHLFVINSIEMFMKEYSKISFETDRNEKYTKLINSFRKRTKKDLKENPMTVINHFTNYSFPEQQKSYGILMDRILSVLKQQIDNKEANEQITATLKQQIDNKEANEQITATFEQLYRLTKKVYDYYADLFYNYVRYNAIDLAGIENNLISDIYHSLNVEENDSDLRKSIHQLLRMIYNDGTNESYKDGIKKNIQDIIYELADNGPAGQFIFDDTMMRINTFEALIRVDSFNQKELIAYAQVMLYITPIFVLCLYVYDLRNSDNMERNFFLNLWDVFNQSLDNG